MILSHILPTGSLPQAYHTQRPLSTLPTIRIFYAFDIRFLRHKNFILGIAPWCPPRYTDSVGECPLAETAEAHSELQQIVSQLAHLSNLVEGMRATAAFAEFVGIIADGGEATVDFLDNTGGFLIWSPTGLSIANLTITVGGMRYPLTAGPSNQPVFIPVPPPLRRATILNTGSANFPYRIQTIPLQFAPLLASLVPTNLTGGFAPIPPVTRGALTNRSGTIAVAGQSQTLAPANPNRNFLQIISLTVIDTLWIGYGVAATAGQPSVPLAPAAAANSYGGGSLEFDGTFIPTDEIFILGATVGDAFTAWEG